MAPYAALSDAAAGLLDLPGDTRDSIRIWRSISGSPGPGATMPRQNRVGGNRPHDSPPYPRRRLRRLRGPSPLRVDTSDMPAAQITAAVERYGTPSTARDPAGISAGTGASRGTAHRMARSAPATPAGSRRPRLGRPALQHLRAAGLAR